MMGSVGNALKPMILIRIWAGCHATYHKLHQISNPELRYDF
jgi:hypothetical protein